VKASDIAVVSTRFVEIFIGQKFQAYEYFVRARFAQTFRRCIEFKALMSMRREKQQRRFASANPHRGAKSRVFVGAQADCDGSPCINDVIAGFA
jgi:hypothetical protein